MSSSFTGLLLVHRLVGKAGQANLLRGVKKVTEQIPAAGGGAGASNTGTGAGLLSGPGTAAGNNYNGILYVCFWKNPLTDVSMLSRFSTSLYAQASSICPSLDVRLLLKKCPTTTDSNSTPIDMIFVDSGIPKADVSSFLVENLHGLIPESIAQHVIFDEDEESVDDEIPSSTLTSTADDKNMDRLFDVVALGGTFDRIHNGHKLLLTEAILRCRNELIVGVTDEYMIKSKSLYELIMPLEDRITAVRRLLEDIAPSTLKLTIVPISDPYGPAITVQDLKLLVVSQETFKAGAKINEIRRLRNLPEVLVHSIQLYPEESTKQNSHEEDKISSSTLRMRNLGERLRPPLKEPTLPYLIGLTGGIASGKSNIAKYLQTFGAGMIDCDELGHLAYTKGTPCFDKIVATFGQDVVNSSTGEMERKVLGGKVFGNPDELKKLTDLVWPEIKRLAEEKIQDFTKLGTEIVVVDAAVLLEAHWDSICHEVWVSFIPRAEAIRRIQERDQLTAEEGEKRIDSQLSNTERLKKATFAFSSLWEVEFTRAQVLKAWNSIHNDMIETL